MQHYILDEALLPGGWASEVAVDVEGGFIRSVEPGAEASGRERIPGIALPGLPNLHSHTFQRAMAGLAEVRGHSADSFWTWREVMYRFLERLGPEDVEAIAGYSMMEMLEGGFTAVGEFHYLHHAPDGLAYADLAELSGRIVAAAVETGIGLTLLPSFYMFGGFGCASPQPSQRRFLNDPARFLDLLASAARHLSAVPDGRLGIAPHSLRAVSPETMGAVVAAAPAGPVHIHAAEQAKEVDDCRAWSGWRPVEWILEHRKPGPDWCVIHATHMTPSETEGLARSGAVAGLCPITEANLGDGIFEARRFVGCEGRFGVGSDSNIEITAAGELKQLEYSQRLKHRERNVLATGPGRSTGRSLYESALAGGAQALGRSIGALAPGLRADFVVLDREHPDLALREGDRRLDLYVFSAGRSALDSVYVGGRRVVEQGVHAKRTEISSRYRRSMARLLA